MAAAKPIIRRLFLILLLLGAPGAWAQSCKFWHEIKFTDGNRGCLTDYPFSKVSPFGFVTDIADTVPRGQNGGYALALPRGGPRCPAVVGFVKITSGPLDPNVARTNCQSALDVEMRAREGNCVCEVALVNGNSRMSKDMFESLAFPDRDPGAVAASSAATARPQAASQAGMPRMVGDPGDANTQRLRSAALSGDRASMTRLGALYDAGQGGVPRDENQALGWYSKAAEMGDGHAMAMLGNMFEQGRAGLPKSDMEALKWYRRGADAGDNQAMTNVAVMYEQGRGGLAMDVDLALAWYRKAADAGHAGAMAYLGYMYREGLNGLAKDDVSAVSWYQKGAILDHPQAMTNLGFMYETGRGGLARDEARAANWYRKAAEVGEAQAMVMLAGMYRDGRGAAVAVNLAQARYWFQRAADLGVESARAALAQLP